MVTVVNAGSWTALGVVVAALGLFGVWLRGFISEMRRSLTSELTRVEQKVDLLREQEAESSTHLQKLMDARFDTVDVKLEGVRDHVAYIEKSLHGRFE
jgi:hypothetical protein